MLASRSFSLLLAIAFVAGCSSQTQATVPLPGSPTDISTWKHSVGRIRPPSVGCFTVSFPATVWTQIACSTANTTLRSHKIGNGGDYMANVGPHVISFAEGSFPSVVGLQSVRSANSGSGWSGSNAYSLQLNSQFFPTTSCGAILHCSGWVQFVYQNPPGSRAGTLMIWDWLVSTTSRKLSGCPPNAGWQNYGGYCVQTSRKSIAVPNQPISNLADMTIAGMADADGDSIVFGVGGTKYAIRNAQRDDVADLSANWQSAEFNVFAPGNGAKATFNAGTTITVGLDVRDGALAAPFCLNNAGTTAEMNNLSFINTPASSPAYALPSIRFRESNVAAPGRSSCRALPGGGTSR